MKARIPVQAAFLLCTVALTPLVMADSIPLQSVNRANQVIDAAIEAHGGADALAELHTVVQKSELITIATGQSRKPGPQYA